MSGTGSIDVPLVIIFGRVLVPRLRALRLDRAYSQAELARRAGVSRKTVMKAEASGEIRPASVRRLAKALGVRPAVLQASQSSST